MLGAGSADHFGEWRTIKPGSEDVSAQLLNSRLVSDDLRPLSIEARVLKARPQRGTIHGQLPWPRLRPGAHSNRRQSSQPSLFCNQTRHGQKYERVGRGDTRQPLVLPGSEDPQPLSDRSLEFHFAIRAETRVSATTTFSPRFSNACRTERRSESARLKHGAYIEARSARIGVATVNRADQGRGGFPDPDPSPGADE
jgi:hypothetical protein